MSGRLSRCSVVQDSELEFKVHQTPKAPTKTGFHTPVKSERKRSLFQPSSPSDSVGLGGLSPLSSCPSSSPAPSVASPIATPGGFFSTPPKYTNLGESPRTTVRQSPRILEVKSSLFPNVKSYTPKSTRNPKFKSTRKQGESTPRRGIRLGRVVTESPNSVHSAPVKKDKTKSPAVSEKKTEIKFSVVSPEDFYGPNPPRARLSLFKERLLEKMPVPAKKTKAKKRSQSNRPHVQRPSKRNGYRIPNNGVWHNIQRPKPLKKVNETKKKPTLTPNTRRKMLESKTIHPAVKRHLDSSESESEEEDEEDIIDPFPESRIKRQLLPAFGPDNATPVGRNKKFFKHSTNGRRATYKTDCNIKLEYSNGQKSYTEIRKKRVKRRKLFTPSKDDCFDDPPLVENIENILQSLDFDVRNDIKLKSPTKVAIERMTDEQLCSILDSPSTKINIVNVSPSRIITTYNNETADQVVDDMSGLAIQEQNTLVDSSPSSLISLGNVISATTDLLVNSSDVPIAPNKENSTSPASQKKLYGLFLKENWSKSKSPIQDVTNLKNGSGKKKHYVPDDQYLLDVGQNSVGMIKCKECGVLYQGGDFADEAIHNSFHKHLPDLRFPGWQKENVVGRYTNGRVLKVINIGNRQYWKKIEKVVEIIDQDLGFPETVTGLDFKTVYLYIDEKAKRIVGCLVAEECTKAFRMFPPIDGSDIDTCSTEPTPCRVGVSRIWTAPSHRRKGIASKLVECLQKSHQIGETLPIDSVAFTAPSPAGKLFAQKVSGRLDILVYGF